MSASRQNRWTTYLQKPFACLVRHSIDRVFAGGEGAEPGELDLSIGTILAVLAAPGAFAAMIVSEKYGSLFRFLRGQPAALDLYAASASDEYFFIVLAMVTAAALAVWKWDRLLPDRRDFLNLAPLPVASRAIFLANLCAVLALAVVLSLDVSAVSCLLFPVFVTFQASFGTFLIFFATHLLAVLLAGVFGFLSVLGFLAATMAIVPFRAFRRVSFYMRCGILFYLAALLATGFSVPARFLVPVAASWPWTRVPPPAWFLGLCESMRGRGNSVFESFAAAALWALLLALLVSLAGFSFSYRRCYLRSAEITGRSASAVSRSFIFRCLDVIFLKNSFERGCYRFVVRTLFRSDEHAFVFGAFATVGVVLASQDLFHAIAAGSVTTQTLPPAPILAVPLVLGFFLIIGLYSAFSIPAPLRSNWIFRLNVDINTRNSDSLARKSVLSLLVPFLFLPCGAVYSCLWGWRVGLLHLALVSAWCVLLLDGLLLKFRKIPFTCSLPGFRSHAIVMALMFLLVFFAFTSVTADVESWMFGDPVRFSLLVPVVITLLVVFYRHRKGMLETDRRLIFEEKSAPVVESMNLVR